MEEKTIIGLREACLAALTREEARQIESAAIRQAVFEMFDEIVNACRRDSPEDKTAARSAVANGGC